MNIFKNRSTEAASNGTAATIASLMTEKRVWTHRKYHFNLAAKPAISLYLHGNVTTDPITKGSIALWEGGYKLI